MSLSEKVLGDTHAFTNTYSNSHIISLLFINIYYVCVSLGILGHIIIRLYQSSELLPLL